MNRVLDRLWIGSTADLEARVPLRSLGFTGVVDLRDGDLPGPRQVEVLRIRNRDGDPWSEKQVSEAMKFILDHVRKGRVLVACVAGMSRSASIVIGYLVRCGTDLPTAYGMVLSARPQIFPLPKMLESVLKVAQEVTSHSPSGRGVGALLPRHKS